MNTVRNNFHTIVVVFLIALFWGCDARMDGRDGKVNINVYANEIGDTVYVVSQSIRYDSRTSDGWKWRHIPLREFSTRAEADSFQREAIAKREAIRKRELCPIQVIEEQP